MESFGLDYYIGHGIFVGWVEHPDIFCWVSFLNPTYVPAIFYCQRNPTKWPKIEPNHSIIPLVREAN
jgi:hypothetical protein